MKKLITLSFILILAFTTLVLAQDTYLNDSLNEKITGTGSKIGEALSEGIKGIEGETDDISTPAPASLQIISQKIFGAPSGTINLETSFIYILLFAMVLIIIHSIISMIGLSTKQIVNWGISIAVTLLMTITGGTQKGIKIYLLMIKDTSLLGDIGAWTIFIWLVIILVVLILASKWIKNTRDKTRIEQAKFKGEEVKRGIDMMKLFNRTKK